MSKFEVTEQMVEAATTAYDDHCEDFDTETQDALDMHASAMRVAITAAIEASGILEENARLRAALERIGFLQRGDGNLPERICEILKEALNKEPTP
jgi:hypothetical protein